ncbi:ATP-dependent Clp protease ATP-binding subunit clpX [Wickerhamomyces ciferrii]|uniref:ATP-dependent Clp protease ATP-binding subunit clpX n=1 Tax=Wickerhamomyces ciferrii (strain ATCC 14091 / BCRC 22168 / CBS 111 / JCM 3599 / NBRC 0793 / NRRL Y-1031 F-60-10) TaxID=1206466 RepID=K0KEQ1_WICCF|nr:ATP-dependent Clp protease ATP-binding subunit clpX [Wickerhamomyces ciferrii]CCH41406.1 ATP-dependent Clp protease ATP-binding subunit clpX [Wickerhamomyces ciferrii]
MLRAAGLRAVRSQRCGYSLVLAQSRFNSSNGSSQTQSQNPKDSSTTPNSNISKKVENRASKERQETHLKVLQDIQNSMVKVPSPRKLKNYLDNYIIGQDTGKKVMSVAVYNHYLRINDKAKKLAKKLAKEKQKEDDAIYSFSDNVKPKKNKDAEQLSFSLDNEDQDLELSKSNILLLGPSGSGKTLIAKTLARVLNVPFSITDCTQLTQAGYIGEDVELCIERLLINSNYDVEKAEKGIVVLDEVDKLSKPSMSNGTKDVAGEGVQQALLKLIEGTNVQVQVKKPVNKEKDSQNNNQQISKKNETYHIDTSNILFVLMGAFIGLDEHISTRLAKSSIGFEADINTDQDKDGKKYSLKQIKLEDGRKVSALELITPQDLTSFGMIPELIGRIPIITGLDSLNETDLLSILTEPKNAILSQYEYIFQQFGVNLKITKPALKKIADLSLKEGTGARGLRGIMERLLLTVNYECPDSGIQFVLVNSETVDSINSGKVKAHYYGRGDLFQFVEDVLEEDPILGKQLQTEFNITPANDHETVAASG